jgi:hypothetical protein
LGTIADLELFE